MLKHKDRFRNIDVRLIIRECPSVQFITLFKETLFFFSMKNLYQGDCVKRNDKLVHNLRRHEEVRKCLCWKKGEVPFQCCFGNPHSLGIRTFSILVWEINGFGMGMGLI